MSIKEIAVRANCHELTVKRLIQMYLKNNGDVRDGRTYGRGMVVPVHIREFILKKETLRQTAHMSLAMKCIYIERETNYQISRT